MHISAVSSDVCASDLLISAVGRTSYAFQNVLCCLRPTRVSMEMFGRGALLTLLCPCNCSIDERPTKAWARSLPHLRYHPKSRLPRPHPSESRRDFVRGTRLA